jgi:hypothetical protein
MEELHTVSTKQGYVIISIDSETRTVHWIEPTEGKSLYTTRQGAHRRREQLEEKLMQAQLEQALEAFIASSDFKSGLISATKASWGGGGYSVELYPTGDWRVLWNNEIGNLYKTPGIILGLPTLTDSEYQKIVIDGGMSEEDFFDLAFSNETDTLSEELRGHFAEAFFS